MASEPLSALLERIASGDPGAFSAWYDEWFDQALASARRAARGDEHAAADLAQEVLMRFVRKTPILETPAAMGAWLKRASLTVAIDRARAEARRRAREARRSTVPHTAAGADAERLDWLRAELEGVDGASESMLFERFGLGRTLAEIGRALGLSPSAVDGRIGRTIRALRKRAEEAFNER